MYFFECWTAGIATVWQLLPETDAELLHFFFWLMPKSTQCSQDVLNAKRSDNASPHFTDWSWTSAKFSLRPFSHISYWYSALPLHQESKLFFSPVAVAFL